jgi:hypothetical protein
MGVIRRDFGAAGLSYMGLNPLQTVGGVNYDYVVCPVYCDDYDNVQRTQQGGSRADVA